MPKPTIGCVIATPGRRSIMRTLHSIGYQGLLPGDDVLVVGDGLHEPTKALVETLGPPFRYLATQPTRDWGHSQLNFGMKQVKGDLLIYQDDDDIFAPRAWDEVRWLGEHFPNCAILGRVMTPNRGILWQEPSTEAILDGHCLVIPNNKELLGYFTPEYDGDQRYIQSCLQHYNEVYWADRVWTLTRPTWKLYPYRGLRGPEQYTYLFARIWALALPELEGRTVEHPGDWAWTLFMKTDEGQVPAAGVRMMLSGDRVLVSIACTPSQNLLHLGEVVEFASWAAQGRDCWVRTVSDDQEIEAALLSRGYTPHGKGEFILDWPPKFFAGGSVAGDHKLVIPRSGQ